MISKQKIDRRDVLHVDVWSNKEKSPQGGVRSISNALNIALFDFFINNRIKILNLLRAMRRFSYCTCVWHLHGQYGVRRGTMLSPLHCNCFSLTVLKQRIFLVIKKTGLCKFFAHVMSWHNWSLLSNEWGSSEREK